MLAEDILTVTLTRVRKFKWSFKNYIKSFTLSKKIKSEKNLKLKKKLFMGPM